MKININIKIRKNDLIFYAKWTKIIFQKVDNDYLFIIHDQKGVYAIKNIGG